jgi:hypothetical protein
MNKLLPVAALAILLAALNTADAQVTGGKHVFQFMMLSPSARVTALGGMQIAVKDDDLGFAATNPAALNPLMDGRLSFNHDFYLAGIQHGNVAFAKQLPKWGFTVQGGIQYVKYGDIKQADELGNITGTVKTGETAFLLGASRPLSDRFSLGLNIRYAISTLDTYHASALAADAGILYADTTHRLTAALVLRNVGTELSTYAGTRENLPYDLQFGITKRLRYLPFRIGVMMHHLQQWNIRYDDPNNVQNDVLLFGSDQTQSTKGNPAIDNFFRHFVFNGEFLLGRNDVFRIRIGYNHLLKKELSVLNYRSLAGFSGGIGLKISRFRIDAGYGAYHLAGGVFHLGIGTNLKEFF